MKTHRHFTRVQLLSAALAGLLASACAQAADLPDMPDLSSGLGTLLRWLLPIWF